LLTSQLLDGKEPKVNHGKAKYQAILGHLSDHFGFKLNDDGSVSSAENVYCMTCHKSNDNYQLDIEFSSYALTKINY